MSLLVARVSIKWIQMDDLDRFGPKATASKIPFVSFKAWSAMYSIQCRSYGCLQLASRPRYHVSWPIWKIKQSSANRFDIFSLVTFFRLAFEDGKIMQNFTPFTHGFNLYCPRPRANVARNPGHCGASLCLRICRDLWIRSIGNAPGGSLGRRVRRGMAAMGFWVRRWNHVDENLTVEKWSDFHGFM